MNIPSVGDRVMPKRDHGRYIRKNKWYEARRIDEYREETNGPVLGYQVQVLDEDGDTYWLMHDAYRTANVQDKALLPIGQNNYRMSQQAYGKILEKAGYKKLGSGAFGYVYAKEGSDKVIKLGGIDDGWLSYGKMVLKKHKDNPHAPKIDYIKVMHEGSKPWYMAKMERLYHLYSEDKYREAQKLYSNLISFAFEGEGKLSARGREWYVKARKKKMLSGDLFNLVADIKNDIYPFFSQDLNANNGMARADGTLVITDPASGQYNRDHRRKAKSRARSSAISMDGQT